MLCLYHNDLDGKCSAVIIRKAFPGCRLKAVDYDRPFPWKEVQNEYVILVDFHLHPFEGMKKLMAVTKRFVWIDHHITAIKEYNAHIDSEDISSFDWEGIRDSGSAGCELTWRWAFPNKKIPKAVSLIGRYDVGDYALPDAITFYYGLLSCATNPTRKHFWERLFSGDSIDNICTQGKVIRRYRIQIEKQELQDAFPIVFKNFKALAVNSKERGRLLTEEMYNHCDIFIKFYMLSNMWKVFLYTNNPSVDVGELARSFGGGGHKSAAGFTCKKLPFSPVKKGESN
jgi:oligoribonuclease NrnB/cAMP/cGMP phosphodiesterase (DHH superfamily)